MNQTQITNAVSDGIQQRATINKITGARLFLFLFIVPVFITACFQKDGIKNTWLIGSLITAPTVLMASGSIEKLRS